MAEDIQTNDTGNGYLRHDTVDTGSGFMALRLVGITVTYPSKWRQTGASGTKTRGIDSSGVGTTEPTNDWKADLGTGGNTAYSNIIVTSDTVFYNEFTSCHSVDKSDGSENWSFDVFNITEDNSTSTSESLYDGTRLYYTNNDADVGQIFSLDPSDGSVNWETSKDKSRGTRGLTKTKDYIVCTTANGQDMNAFDPSDGSHVWSNTNMGSHRIAYDSDDDTIIGLNANGKLTGWDQSDGTTVVKQSDGSLSTTAMKSILLADNDMFCFNDDNFIRAFRSGLNIDYEVGLGISKGQGFTISDSGNKVFIVGETGGGNGVVIAKDAVDGTKSWSNDAWTNPPTSGVRDICILSKDESIIYAGNNDGIVKAFDRDDGTVQWSKDMFDSGGILALAITDNVLYAQEADEGDSPIKAFS